jgi:branched-chain amino acid transport system substrate-binding protein
MMDLNANRCVQKYRANVTSMLLGVGKILVAGLFLATAPLRPATAEDGVTANTITIGTFGPLSGPNYFNGDPIMDGSETVFRMVNEAGGIYGRKIELVREDDRCDPQTGITAVKKLIYDDKVFMINGGGCSNPAIAALPDIVQAKIPWVIFAAVSDQLTTPTTPFIWRTSLCATVESRAQVQYAADHGVKKLGIIFTNDPWGRDRMLAVHAFLKEREIPVAAEEEITADSNDATPQVLHMKQAGIDTVLLVVFPKPAAVFIRDSAKLAFKPIMVGTSALAGLEELRDLVGRGDAPMQNVVSINHVGFTEQEAPSLVWAKAYKTYFPSKNWTIYPLFGISSALVVVEALREAGPDLTREKFRDAMDHLQGYFTGVYSGPITCTPDDHQCNKTAAIVGLRDGKLATVGRASVR